MTKLKRIGRLAERSRAAMAGSLSVFLRDVGNGLLEVSHNSLALLGLLVVGAVLFAAGRADLRQSLETETLGWLQARQEARQQELAVVEEPDLSEPDAVARATAADPKDLSRTQAAVAIWLARRYRVAPEPVSRLVQEAWHVGELTKLDPTLILAVMAIESNFNPFAQSAVGAQGLMQVMTKIHDDKYEPFGGRHAAFDPVTNLRVGVQVLKECIARAGSLEAGLRHYVGAANLGDDGGYAAKVLAEQATLQLVAAGRVRPAQAPTLLRVKAATPPAEPVAPAPQPALAEQPPAPLTEKIALAR